MSGGKDLAISTAKLQELGRKLRFIATEFENAEKIADNYREFVGHDGLAEKLEEFADNWDDTRESMTEAIASYGEAAQKAAELFEELETELVATLTGEK